MKSGNKEELNRESGRNHLESEKWFKSGLKYAKLGQPKEATEHFEEAVWLDPNNHKIHNPIPSSSRRANSKKHNKPTRYSKSFKISFLSYASF